MPDVVIEHLYFRHIVNQMVEVERTERLRSGVLYHTDGATGIDNHKLGFPRLFHGRQCYLTCAPGFTSADGEMTTSEPSGFIAERIIPCDSTPLSFLGAKLATKHTCLPTRSSG